MLDIRCNRSTSLPAERHFPESHYPDVSGRAATPLPRRRPVHCGMLGSVLGLHPLDAGSTLYSPLPVCDNQSVSAHCRMSPRGKTAHSGEALPLSNTTEGPCLTSVSKLSWITQHAPFPQKKHRNWAPPRMLGSFGSCPLSVHACPEDAAPDPRLTYVSGAHSRFLNLIKQDVKSMNYEYEKVLISLKIS